MSRSIEKNDVDITQLFKWSREVTISDPVTSTDVTVYVRLIGDADLNIARTSAIRKSGELRRKLRSPDSSERVSFINEISELKDKETIVTFILLLMTEQIQNEAVKSTSVPFPKDIKADATLEEQEKYQEEIDDYPKVFTKAVGKEIKKIQKTELKRLESLTQEQLYNEYERLVIDRLCQAEMIDSYYEQCVFFGTYTDSEFKKKAFKSFETFQNIATKLKDQLIEEYKNLEVGMEMLKK